MSDPRPSALRTVVAACIGVAAIAVGAMIEVPMEPVPTTLQTLAVLCVASACRVRTTLLCIASYLTLGGLGVPIFAKGKSGLDHLFGGTGGYLIGFLIAGGLVSYWISRDRTEDHEYHQEPILWALTRGLVFVFIGHALILLVGVAWLATSKGVGSAIRGGLLPFLLGASLKSMLATGFAGFVAIREKAAREAAK